MDVIDLFSGCGGLSLGFRDLGFNSVLSVENDAHAAATFRYNIGGPMFEDDILKLTSADIPAADVVIGGPPCQGFSQLGQQDPDDERNTLWIEFARVVQVAHPKVFVLENVPRFLKSGQWQLMQEFTRRGQPLEGYSLVSGVLNAADFGVAQRRKRAIVIGSRIGHPTLPLPTHGEGTPLRWQNLRDAIGDLPLEATQRELPDRESGGVVGPFRREDLHLRRNPTELSLKRYDNIPPGGNRFDLPAELLPPCWARKPAGTTDVMGRLVWDKPALTVRTEFFKPEKGRYLHPQFDLCDEAARANRPITHWEAARIQSFPDDFAWFGSKLSIARQIGNAVPPLLARELAKHVVDHMSDPESAPIIHARGAQGELFSTSGVLP